MNRKMVAFASALAVCRIWAPLEGATLVVDPGGGAAYTDIQSAIDAAADGDTVLVKPGEYVIAEPVDFNRLHDPGDPASPAVKDLVVRSEGGAEVTTIRMSETPADYGRVSVVLFESGEGQTSILEGFTVTGGLRGGVTCDHVLGCSPTLTRCTISGNSGGGVVCGANSAPTLTDCTISGNSCGGVSCGSNSSPRLTNCTISGNPEGGLHCGEGSTPTLTSCIISGNSTSFFCSLACGGGIGGGVFCGPSSSPTLTRCTISGNSADWYGGGMYCAVDSSPILTTCTISGNSNGGLYCAGSSPALTNCTISGNAAFLECWALACGGGIGDGVYCDDGSSPTLTRCTISGNLDGGVHCDNGSSPTLTECIVWGNAGGSWVVSDEGSEPLVTFSCLETDDVVAGEGNINGDPLFCGFAGPPELFVDAGSAEGGDGTTERPLRDLAVALRYRLSLREDSPCIGAGEHGANLGADLGTCEAGGATEGVRVHVASGRYPIEGLSLAHGASIVGAGQERTVLEGTVWGLRTGATLSGLTVTGGTRGGVVIGPGERPTLVDCTISGNSATYGGGGVYCSGSSPVLTNCTISGNSAGWYGRAGVYCDNGASPILTGCAISENSDGGVYCESGSSPTLTTCTIAGNSGDALTCDESSPTLTGCTISGNSGCGVCCWSSSSPTLANCTISANWESGVRCGEGASPSLTSCTISGNSAAWGGGVYCDDGSSPSLTNCTISGNLDGGVHCRKGSSPTLKNTIVWGNIGGSWNGSDEGSESLVTFSCLETDDVVAGEGNINADPLFCGFDGPPELFVDAGSAEGGDGTAERPFRDLAVALEFRLSLREDSPCIGGGADGANLGADLGTCEAGGTNEGVLVRAASGRYPIEGLNLARGASIAGAGQERTVLEGTVWGLRTGATLSGLTVTGGTRGGVVIRSGESPSLRDCTISGSSSHGLICSGASPILTTCTISGNSGGGVDCGDDSAPTLTSCAILGNSDDGVSCRSSSAPTLTTCMIAGNSGSGLSCTYDSSPTLAGCTISGNLDGGVRCDERSSPTLTSCTISGNSAGWDRGGGVDCGRDSAPTLASCTISGNSGGGVFCWDNSSPTLTDCTVSENSAGWDDRGGVYCEGTAAPTLKNCTISRNSLGGMHCAGNSSPTLTSCIVWGNPGGSWIVSDERAHPLVTFSCLETEQVMAGEGNSNGNPLFCGFAGPLELFVDAASPEGGDGTAERPFRDLAVALEFQLSLREDSPCVGAGEDGANMGADLGACDAGDATEGVLVHVASGRYPIEGLGLAHGTSIVGEGRERTVLEGTVWGLRTGATLAGLTVTGGTRGGVVIGAGESPTLMDCTISGNSGTYGGGVHCWYDSAPTLMDCTISGNSSEFGGVYCSGSSPTLTRCTIFGNSGGGVFCWNGSSPTLTNCVISGNEGPHGGGVFCWNHSSPTLTNCTISGNSSVWSGGGVACSRSSPTLTNCVVWGNRPESVCGNVSHCLTAQDPLFVRRGQWADCASTGDPLCVAYRWDPETGQPTAWHRWVFDYHLGPGSPAIDAGTAEGAPTTDLEGKARPCGSGVDIGAYEFGNCWSTQSFRRGDANVDGATDISDALAILGYLFLLRGEETVPCEQAADANDDGALDISDALYVLRFLFLGGHPIGPPVEQCGIDPTGHDLPCAAFPPCG